MNSTVKDKGGEASPKSLVAGFRRFSYILDDEAATAIFLASKLDQPLLVEGPPGVGKTSIAKAAASYFDFPLIRLQCYQGLDEARALFEWNHAKQLLYTQLMQKQIGSGKGLAKLSGQDLDQLDSAWYSRRFLYQRPLLKALESSGRSVLLIDEIDRVDEEFEAYLLEFLGEFQISIPELGTVSADQPPLVIITSNDSRELSEALKRRCIHLWLSFPERSREEQIVKLKVPAIASQLAAKLVGFVHSLRELELRKPPAISETIDWAKALLQLAAPDLEVKTIEESLGVLLKFQIDREEVLAQIPKLLQNSSPSMQGQGQGPSQAVEQTALS